MCIHAFSPFLVVMASYDKRESSKEHINEIQTRKKDKEGSASRETEFNPNDLDKLKKAFIFPVKDVSLKLKKAWKVCYNTNVHVHCVHMAEFKVTCSHQPFFVSFSRATNHYTTCIYLHACIGQLTI